MRAAVRLVLLMDHSCGQRQHMDVHEGFKALTRVDLREFCFCDLHQSLQKVLEIHVGLIAVHGTEDQIQSLFHLFVKGVHVC